MTTKYRRSSGELVAPADMPTEHLQAALAKLQRDEPHRRAEIAAMQAELDGRPGTAPPAAPARPARRPWRF